MSCVHRYVQRAYEPQWYEKFQPSVVVLNDHRNILLLIENILHDRNVDTDFT
jgi:hypothetical protein